MSILCDEPTFRAARARLSFSALAPLKLKGFTAPVPVFCPLPTPASVPVPSADQELIGREREYQLIATQIDNLRQNGTGGLLIIEGEAGIGKSVLIDAARRHARAAGLLVLSGAGSPLDLPPYHAWGAIFAELLPFLAEAAPRELPADVLVLLADLPRQGEHGAYALAHAALLVLAALELLELAPLLAVVLPLSLPESTETATLAGQARADQTRDLLVRLLSHGAARMPMLLIFEDAQALDPSSWALLQAVVARVPALLCLVATRLMAAPPLAFQQLAYRPASTRIQLRGLAPEELRQLLARRLAVAAIPDALSELIVARAQGNPFVGEELLHALRERGALVVVDGVCSLVSSDPAHLVAPGSLPDTVEGLITSRIDRLSAAQQLTLKVASVIGPQFTLRALAAIHPVEHDQEQLVVQLFALQQAGLVVIEAFESDLVYAFKSAVSCEVAYNLMSFAQRRRLHQQLAERYEAAPDELPLGLARIAHHWLHAEQPLRAMPYLARAGGEALRNGAYREASALLAEALAIGARGPESPPLDALTQARWERQFGEALLGLGRLAESRAQLTCAAARLGYPLERRSERLLWALCAELMFAAVLVLLPQKRKAAQPDPAALSEAVCVYALLSRLTYYAGRPLAALYVTLRARNLAARARR